MLRLWVERISRDRDEAFGGARECGQELVVYALLHEDARTSNAILACSYHVRGSDTR